ncbi:hypothetical protein B0H13DRAFT_2392816 [Mycena leptocephala]|nr:hypothetical protein B0H13DRAFT_2392816 [Mycena leptocephala]
MPSLKSLVLRGVSLKIPGVSSLVDHLENLDLFATFPRLVMQLAEHFDASSRRTEAISCLRHLSLRSTPPQLHLSSAAFKSYISSLTTLTLGHFHHQDLQSFCRLLCTPLLEELALTNLSRMCWDSFATSLSDESSSSPPSAPSNCHSFPNARCIGNSPPHSPRWNTSVFSTSTAPVPVSVIAARFNSLAASPQLDSQ